MMNGGKPQTISLGRIESDTRRVIRELLERVIREKVILSPMLKNIAKAVQGTLTRLYFYLRQNTLEALQDVLEGTRSKKNT